MGTQTRTLRQVLVLLFHLYMLISEEFISNNSHISMILLSIVLLPATSTAASTSFAPFTITTSFSITVTTRPSTITTFFSAMWLLLRCIWTGSISITHLTIITTHGWHTRVWNHLTFLVVHSITHVGLQPLTTTSMVYISKNDNFKTKQQFLSITFVCIPITTKSSVNMEQLVWTWTWPFEKWGTKTALHNMYTYEKC